MEVWQVVVPPLAPGLPGFVEPCALAAHGLFAAYLRGRPPAGRVAEPVRFAAARAAVFGLLGLGAALAGQAVLALRGAERCAVSGARAWPRWPGGAPVLRAVGFLLWHGEAPGARRGDEWQLIDLAVSGNPRIQPDSSTCSSTSVDGRVAAV